MSYDYDMEKHFRKIRSELDERPSVFESGTPAGRIYLNARPGPQRSIRTESTTRRFLSWIKTRKPKPGERS